MDKQFTPHAVVTMARVTKRPIAKLYAEIRERKHAAHESRLPVDKIPALKRLAVVDAKTVRLPPKQTLNPPSPTQPDRADGAAKSGGQIRE